MPVDEQRELAERGAMLERCFAPIHTRQGLVGADVRRDPRDRAPSTTSSRPISARCTNPPVEDGLALMADRLLEAGFREDDVRTMAVANTRMLAGA